MQVKITFTNHITVPGSILIINCEYKSVFHVEGSKFKCSETKCGFHHFQQLNANLISLKRHSTNGKGWMEFQWLEFNWLFCIIPLCNNCIYSSNVRGSVYRQCNCIYIPYHIICTYIYLKKKIRLWSNTLYFRRRFMLFKKNLILPNNQ